MLKIKTVRSGDVAGSARSAMTCLIVAGTIALHGCRGLAPAQAPADPTPPKPPLSLDVTELLRKNGYKPLQVKYSTMGGDPAFGESKHLWVAYRQNGEVKTFYCNEYWDWMLPEGASVVEAHFGLVPKDWKPSAERLAEQIAPVSDAAAPATENPAPFFGEMTGEFATPPRGWEGLRVAILGDSITDKGQTKSQNTYWQYLAAWLKWDVHAYGISGQRWLQIPAQTKKMAEEMGTDVDAVLILMGTNDFAEGVPLGEWFERKEGTVNWFGQDCKLERRTFSFDNRTVRGRINIALADLKKRYPETQIVLLTPLQRSLFTYNNQPDQTWQGRAKLYLDDYVRTVREGAAIWSCPVVDLYAESGLTPLVDAEYSRYFRSREKDLLHPNSAGHRRIADLVYTRLKALPGTFRRIGGK